VSGSVVKYYLLILDPRGVERVWQRQHAWVGANYLLKLYQIIQGQGYDWVDEFNMKLHKYETDDA